MLDTFFNAFLFRAGQSSLCLFELLLSCRRHIRAYGRVRIKRLGSCSVWLKPKEDIFTGEVIDQVNRSFFSDVAWHMDRNCVVTRCHVEAEVAAAIGEDLRPGARAVTFNNQIKSRLPGIGVAHLSRNLLRQHGTSTKSKKRGDDQWADYWAEHHFP